MITPQSTIVDYSWVTNVKDIDYEGSLTHLHSETGMLFLQNSTSQQLSQYDTILPSFQPQQNGAFCAIASICILNNCLRKDSIYDQKRLWEILVNELEFDPELLRYGLSLKQAACLAH